VLDGGSGEVVRWVLMGRDVGSPDADYCGAITRFLGQGDEEWVMVPDYLLAMENGIMLFEEKKLL
jgi:hypothetical protein